MKHIIILISCLASITGSAQEQSIQKLSIEQATVFISGAELLSTAKISLVKGENEILFTNVAGNVNGQSIIVNATGGVVVESATFQNDYVHTENKTSKIKSIEDSVELVIARQQQLTNKIASLDEQIKVLKANQTVGGANTGLSVNELQKLLDLVGSRMEDLLNKQSKASALNDKYDEQKANLQQQLAEEQKKDHTPGGLLLVKFYTDVAVSSDVTISYIITGAGWSPAYDIIAADSHSPIKLFYKAKIYQNSGVKWSNVHLVLSTGNPQEAMQAPVLSPLYLAFYQPQVTYDQNGGHSLKEVAVQYKKPLVNAYQQNTDLAAGAAGSYQPQRGSAQQRDGNRYIIDAVQVPSSITNHVAVDNEGVNTSFDIDLPYTIPSDGQDHLVAVKKYDVPATYQYFSAPKADKDAFLQAQITNWQELNLLPGPTNIIYEGTYVGHGYIDTREVTDTMYVSMGRDKKIIIKKERDKNKRSVKMIGSNVREAFTYNITIRNTRKESATIVLEDQLPVSNDKDIVLEDQEIAKADIEEATGLMKWTLKLAPNETKKLTFGYVIKYPKGKTIVNMK